MANPSYRWFDLVYRDKNLRSDNDALAWLAEASNTTFTFLTQSNFDLVSNEAFLDIPSFGTAIISEEFKETGGSFDKLIFSSVPLDQGYYELDDEGRPNFFWRTLLWTPNQFFSKFGKGVTLPQRVQKKLDDNKNDEKFELVYSIFPRRDKQNVDIRGKLAPLERPFGVRYFMGDDGTPVGEESGYYQMPVYTPMWRKTSRSSFGHSPAMVVLSDILTLNQLVEMILKASEKAIDPPLGTTRRGVFGDVDLTPGGVTVTAGKDSLWHLESKARFDVGHLEKNDLQDSIRKAFFEDQLKLKESPEMTAAEVYTRFELMARLIGPSAGRIQHDFHGRVVTQTFNGLYRYRVFPAPPDKVARADIDVDFIGPMARAQKLDKVANIERYTQNIGGMSEIFPNITDNINSDGIAAELARYLTVPREVLNTTAERNTIRKDRKKQEQELMDLEKAKMVSESAKNVAPMMQAGGNDSGTNTGTIAG
jgi:hypothetical protein